jgi:hypothetical protein
MHASKDSMWRMKEEIFWVCMASERGLDHSHRLPGCYYDTIALGRPLGEWGEHGFGGGAAGRQVDAAPAASQEKNCRQTENLWEGLHLGFWGWAQGPAEPTRDPG